MKTDEKLDLVLKTLKIEFSSINKRFEQVDRRLDQIDKRFEQVDRRLESIEFQLQTMKQDIRRNEEKLEKVYETRHEVQYKIGRDFILKNLSWNMSIIVLGLILGKLILLG